MLRPNIVSGNRQIVAIENVENRKFVGSCLALLVVLPSDAFFNRLLSNN